MPGKTRSILFDSDLKIEAYQFNGIAQPFPNHFHDHYVIGYMENGNRHLICKQKEYTISAGSLLLFNPGDNHACSQVGDQPLCYRALNIAKPVMQKAFLEVTGQDVLPLFDENILFDPQLSTSILTLHQAMMHNAPIFEKEEQFLLCMTMLFKHCTISFATQVACPQAVMSACRFMNRHYTEPLTLDAVCHAAGCSKSTLLRAFAKGKGITPYRYLESLRIDAAKILLQQNVSPADAALQTGFFDQSHFSNAFHAFTGLSPGMYRAIFNKQKEPPQ